MLKRILNKTLKTVGYQLQKIEEPKENILVKKDAWSYQKDWVMPHIKTEDLVLDIGSGNNPSPRANILADYFPDESIHRQGAVVEDRPLVVCSLENLPFKKKAFQFSICSHVFEHLEHPEIAAKEIGRVSDAGYIETPAYGKDILVGSGYMHLWQVVSFENKMYFFQYSDREHEAFVHSPVMDLWVQKNHHPWQDYFWARQDLFNACLLWKDTPEIEVFRRKVNNIPVKKDFQNVDLSKISTAPPSLTKDEITILENILTVPGSDSTMKFEEDKFVNADKTVVFPVRAKRIYCEIPY